MEPRTSPKSHFFRKRPTLSSTHYLLCIIHISPSENDTFLLPGATENGWIPWFSFPNARKPLKTAAGDPKSAPPGGTWRPQGSQWAPKCLPNATQNHQKMASCVQPPPEDHQNHRLAPKNLQNRWKIDIKPPPALVENFAVVVPFRGQDHRCVRGPRGKIRDGGALQRTKSQASSRTWWKILVHLIPAPIPRAQRTGRSPTGLPQIHMMNLRFSILEAFFRLK